MDASMPTAIFVDAGFFLKRFRIVYPDRDAEDAVLVARSLHEMALDHLRQRGDDGRRDLRLRSSGTGFIVNSNVCERSPCAWAACRITVHGR